MLSDNKKSFVISNIDTSEQEVFDLGDYRIGYFIKRSQLGLSNNQDAIFGMLIEKGFVLGVSDGAGGHPKGQEAAQLACEVISKGFSSFSKNCFSPQPLIEHANDEIKAMKVGARCTLSFIALTNDCLRAYNVGDSEVLYWNSSGSKLYSNIPHSTVGYKVEAGEVDQAQSLEEDDRYLVTNMLGDENIRIESTSGFNLKKGHTIVIGTDGIFDNLSHESLSEIISGGVFDESFQSLCHICEEQNEQVWKKDDDIAFIVLRKMKS